MKIPLFILTVFAGFDVFAQATPHKQLVSSVEIDRNYKDTFAFTKQWDYPWFIVIDDSGKMENILADTLTDTDTARLYYTANCWTNHQGTHNVRYCVASLSNDTINLFFQPELPAYVSNLSVSIKGNRFSSDFFAQ